MELLAPGWLVGLLLVPAIFLWGLWAPRGRPVTVGSLMLWRRVLASGPAGKPSARVRLRDPLLWLDAAAVLLVVLACARPAMKTAAPAAPVATLVIDRTASMTTDGGDGPRFRRALAMAEALLRPMGAVPLRVVLVPGPLGASELHDVSSDRLFAGGWDYWSPVAAAAEAASAATAQAAADSDRPVLLITDVAPASPLPPNLHVLATGGRSRNAGLTRVAARIEGSRAWLLVEAKADPEAPGPCRLVVSGDGKTIADKAGFLDPGKAAETTVEIPGPLPKQLRAGLFGPQGTPATLEDGFPWDNSATLALAPAAGVRVLLMGRPAPALRRALAAREGAEIIEAAAGEKVVPGEADLVVACGVPLPAAWTGPAAVIAPGEAVGPVRPPARSAVAANGDGSAALAPEWHVVSAHPLAEALYLEPPRLAPVRRYTVASGAQLLLGTPDAPLIVTWQDGGARRLAVLFDFDEKATDWPRRAGFPVFWSHAVDWLVPKETRRAVYKSYRPFEPVPGGGLAAGTPGFHQDAAGRTYGVSFIGTDEGFQSGPARDDSKAAVEAIRQSIEAKRRAALSDLWPWLAAAALVALLARAWVAR
ncbi:MAG: BatA domain-containing protein [Planctomycetota bacterium]|nr:BatA domain-containing protein [Planctomycetota bacterium]